MKGLTHRRNTNQRRRNTSIQAPRQPFPRNRLFHHIYGTRINALFSCLHAHFDEIEGVADDDGADTANTASDKRSDLCETLGGGGLFGGGEDFLVVLCCGG